MILGKYMRWLHTGWPAGHVEKLPEIREDGTTAVPGVRVVGDLTGIPLLKFSADTGARAAHAVVEELKGTGGRGEGDKTLDLAIVGGGVAGMSAAIEAKKAGLRFVLYEASEPFSTVINFPKGKPIYTYPTDMTPAGDLQFRAHVKEDLVAELCEQQRQAGIEPVHARVERISRSGGTLGVHLADRSEPVKTRRVIVAIGRSGNFRKLGVPGDDLDKVYNRLHDPQEFAGKCVLVVGGGDSALETAIATARAGANVTLSYRKPEFSRAKPDNVEGINQLLADPAADVQVEEPTSERVTTSFTSNICTGQGGCIALAMPSEVVEIRERDVDLKDKDGKITTLPNEVVFSMIGREPPLEFFRRSGIPIRGEWRVKTWISFILIVALFTFIYHWKKSGVFLAVYEMFAERNWFPFNVSAWWAGLGTTFSDPRTLVGTLKVSVGEPGFYYSVAYCVLMTVFGIRRIRRRKTPYVTRQTLTLVAIQVIPLFLLPYVVLPWFGANGWFDSGPLKRVADALFPVVDYGHGREYWRAYGFILAWPLFFWNVFNHQPLWGWLAIGFVQTFVLIPLMIRRWGKGAYCGWICSCGGMAETLGDTQRQKMPHGPKWNRANMLGQFFLAVTFFLLITRSLSWAWPGSVFERMYDGVFKGLPGLNYVWFVDLLWAGIIGFGFYWHFSGRVWCRFACPLAALMHIYARFTRFRIFADKKKCISCNVCTSVCHQGIDVMNFANKGLGMTDPECVRCSACVQSCPTGVLTFGRIGADGEPVHDKLAASPVQMAESRGVKSLPVVS